MSLAKPLSNKKLSEQDARTALNAWCASSVFRLPKLGDEAEFTHFEQFEYYFVSLTSLVEHRTLRVVEEPFKKGPVDEGNNKDVWSVTGSPPNAFEKKKYKVRLPQSESVAD